MAKLSVLPRLHDILQAIAKAQRYIAGVDPEGYRSSDMEHMAVERCIEVKSEASRHIPDELTSPHPSIPWHEIRGIGNRLRHEYQRVDDTIIWLAVTRSLPELKLAIEAMIARLESAHPPSTSES